MPFENLKIKAITDNGEYVAERIHRNSFVSSLGNTIQRAEGFVLKIPLKECKDIFSVKLALEIDGSESIEIKDGDIIKVEKAEHCAKIIKVSDRSFYQLLKEKLSKANGNI